MANPFADAKNEVKPKEKHTEPIPVVEIQSETIPESKKSKKNPVAGLIEEKPGGKSGAVYLDLDVWAGLDKVAKENKTNRSRIINALLRQALFEE